MTVELPKLVGPDGSALPYARLEIIETGQVFTFESFLELATFGAEAAHACLKLGSAAAKVAEHAKGEIAKKSN